MRIAFDATPLLDVRTGVGTFVEELLHRLALTEGVEVVAFGLTRKYLGELARRLPPGVGITRHPIPSRTTRKLWLRLDHPTIEWWTGPIDVVHGPNFVVPPGRDATELMTVHDLTPLRFPEMCDDNTIQFPRLMQRALNRGAHVHTHSHFVAEEVMDAFGVGPDRVHPVHSGVTPIQPGDPDRGRARAGGDRYVLAIGTIEPRKNLAVLVEAFDRVATDDREVRLVLAGASGWRIETFERALDHAVHASRIVRLGRIDDGARADLLAGASVLAYPSLYEGFGYPPLEAMSAGVPVVATTAGSLPEVLGNAALLVAPAADEVADGLAQILTDSVLRVELVRRGRVRASRYSWDRCATELVALYNQLAGS